jgi:D-3-phosphoglycerate dehydrogenase
MKPVVLLTNPIHPAPAAMISARAELRLAPATDAASLIAAAEDADVVIVRSPLPPELFARARRLRGAIRHGAGVDMIPVEAASRHGVAVANAPGTNAASVAEYALGQMISLSRRLQEIDRTLRTQGWPAARQLSEGTFELAGRTVGLVGVGAIGEELGRICDAGLRMKVIGYRPSTRPMPAYIQAVALEELFASADVVVLACPLNDATRGMVNQRLLGSMKKSALLINVSRGPVVDEEALIAVLREGRIRGAALDVFACQPLPDSSPLLQLPNVILSSHIAGITDDSMRRMGEMVALQTLELLDGRLPTHFVNQDARPHVLKRLELLTQT